MSLRVSVVLPAYNEAENLAEVVQEIHQAITDAGLTHEVIVVDDGSVDETRAVLRTLECGDPRVRSARLRRNFGKSIALLAGIQMAKGQIIVLMDADGQDDPSEIPKLIDALGSGLHLATGRRVVRQDRFVKRVSSRVFNQVTARVTGVTGRDMNSGLKAMRREVADSLNLYGELHRFIPVLVHWAGFRVGEVSVNHRPRRRGVSKFGGTRFWRGFLDLLTIQFLTRFTARPLHLFGGLGLVLGAAGCALLAWMAVLRVIGEGVGNRPALAAGVLLVVVAMQFFSIGLLAEFFAHTRGKVDVSQLTDSDEESLRSGSDRRSNP